MALAKFRTAGLAILVITAGSCAPRTLVNIPGIELTAACRGLVDGAGGPRTDVLRWHSPESADDRRALNLSCATVGAAVYEQHQTSAVPSASSADDLVVASWNVHVGGGDLGAFVADLRAGRLTDGVPPREFVILVQEAFRGGPAVPQSIPPGVPIPGRIEARTASGSRDDVIATAAELGLAVFYVPSMRNGPTTGERSEDRGNAILSTLPLTELAGIELPYVRQRRVAAAATITGRDSDNRPWRLRVVSLHLDASSGPKQLWLLSSALREQQASYVVDLLDDDDLPTVVGSDLNTWAGGRREAAYALMRRGFPETVAVTGTTFGKWLTLDYLFFRLPSSWQGESRAETADFGSDHRPVVGRIRIGAS